MRRPLRVVSSYTVGVERLHIRVLVSEGKFRCYGVRGTVEEDRTSLKVYVVLDLCEYAATLKSLKAATALVQAAVVTTFTVMWIVALKRSPEPAARSIIGVVLSGLPIALALPSLKEDSLATS